MIRPSVLVCCLGVTISLPACSAPAPDATPPSVRIPFSPGDASCCLSLEQHVRLESPRGSAEFDVFVETHGHDVVLVGMTSYGVRAFTVVHDAAGLHVDAAPIPELAAVPFDRVVRDVYVAFLLPAGFPDRSDATSEDRIDAGRLLSRAVVFEPDSDHPDRVVIDYGDGWRTDADPPSEVVVTHAQPPLRIAITTRETSRNP